MKEIWRKLSTRPISSFNYPRLAKSAALASWRYASKTTAATVATVVFAVFILGGILLIYIGSVLIPPSMKKPVNDLMAEIEA